MDNQRHYGGGSSHAEIRDSNLFGGQKFFFGSGSQTRKYVHHKIMKSLEAQTEKSTFLGLLPMTNQDEYISKIDPIHRDSPKLYWIFKNIDFEHWESADSSQMLWVFGPHDHGVTAASSYIIDLAKEGASQTKGVVFYFFCSAVEKSSVATNFTHTFLRHILNGSEDVQAKSIATTFLSTLLRNILLRDSSRFHKEDSSITTVKKILNALDGELLEALTEAVVHIREVQEASIIIDGIDKIGQEGASFVNRYLQKTKAIPKFKAFVTSQPDPYIKAIVNGLPCIEYNQERKECLASLRHDDTRYDMISEEYSGSLEWLWTHSQYQEWSASEGSSLLYIEGKPGSGKSTLTKYFSNNLAKMDPNASSKIIASYFYTERGTQLERTHENMLRTILSRILEQDETAFYLFQAQFRETQHRKDSNWSYNTLKKVLSSFTNHPASQQICLILDAMDESEDSDRREIIQLLCQLCSNGNTCNIKVFLASRPMAELRHRIQEHHVITLQEENEQDIYKLANDFLRLELGVSGDILGKATEYISTHAQGVFVWVDLVQKELLTYVEHGRNVEGIIDFLKIIPYKELNDLYNQMLERLKSYDNQDIQDGVRIFRFVLFACRPLTVIELYNAFAIPEDSDPLFLPCHKSFERDTRTMEKRIIHCGGNFLETKGHKDKTIQAMHQTVREFFLYPKQDEANSPFMMTGLRGQKAAHIAITTTCVRYLQFCFLNSSIQDDFPSVQAWASNHFEAYVKYLDQWPLINYALEYLKEHLDGCGQEEKTSLLVSTLINQLIDNQSSRFLGEWIASHLGQTDPIYTHQVTDSDFKSATHKFIAKAQLSRMTNSLLRKVSRLGLAERTRTHQVTDETGSSTGDAEMDFKYETLNAAANIGLSRVTNALLLTCDSQRQTYLLISAGKGHEATVRLLLDQGVDKEFQDNSGQRALHHAVMNGHESVAELLLKKGAERSARDKQGQTPLRLAILKWQRVRFTQADQ
ncbi:hypothetical protein BDD12DRAFT_473820 [Trichophaea hybrida]|nr:hypothetical protein BDD12DRAFT_473820 [Trichophaea hybrida]